jgi:hypothetical protein
MELGKRKHERCTFSQVIAYSFPSCFGDKFSTGMLHDISYSGLCLITRSPLQHGQEILVKSSLLSKATTAIVRWCSDLDNSKYKVGLEFKN